MREILKQKLLWIAAFGYFVDLFDLVLYGAVRVDSLKSLGYQGTELLNIGALLLNIQMAGMLIGGVFWGILGDRRGRKEALFGSILIYSLATFLNAYVHDFTGYASLRFIAGFGLAGELGAAITLVSETLPKKTRGLGAVMVASIGFLGAAAASLLSQHVSWENAYRIGGCLGITLLIFRFSVQESKIYLRNRNLNKEETWGSMKLIFESKSRMKLMGLVLLVGVPIWYVAGILSYFAPEFAKSLKIAGEITAAKTIMMGYLGSIVGDIACGLLSQWLKSRKKAVLIFIFGGSFLALFHPLFLVGSSAALFYWVRFGIGFGCGYVSMLIIWIAEMFGTNLRATQTTTLSNLIRASVIPLTLSFRYLIPHFGLISASVIVGTFSFVFSALACIKLPETFDRDMNYLEN